jgi:RNA polymerase sigma-70 factor (ECF subfamily)
VQLAISSWVEAMTDASTRSATDAELVDVVQHGTPDEAQAAWAVLFDRSIGSLERSVAARGLVKSEIEDVLQETWARALAKIGTYEQRGAPFVAWLHGIARKVMLEKARRRLYQRPEGYEPPSTGSDSVDPLEQVVTEEDVARRRETLLAAIAGLSPEQRAVVEGRLILGKSSRDVAADLGCSPSNVDVLLYRARATLRATLVAVGQDMEGSAHG